MNMIKMRVEFQWILQQSSCLLTAGVSVNMDILFVHFVGIWPGSCILVSPVFSAKYFGNKGEHFLCINAVIKTDD